MLNLWLDHLDAECSASSALPYASAPAMETG